MCAVAATAAALAAAAAAVPLAAALVAAALSALVALAAVLTAGPKDLLGDHLLQRVVASRSWLEPHLLR